MYIVFDLDGTLCDITHRLHHIQKQPKDWRAFFAACVDDKPVEPIIAIAWLLMRTYGMRVEIWSGRSDEVRKETEEWLRFNLPGTFPILRMRKAGDHRPDDELKAEWLDTIPEGKRPVLAFDDRQRVVDMWRSRGVQCCQVAAGDF